MTPGKEQIVYALGDPVAVDIVAIERELEALWRTAHSEDGSAVLHAAAFNLVYVINMAADYGDAPEILRALTLADPSRALLLRIGDAQTPASQRAWVTAYCHRPAPDSQQICSEFIQVDITGNETEGVVSTLLSLRLPGLPTIFIWDASLPPAHPLLIALGSQADRVITALIPPCAPASSWTAFFSLQDDLGHKPLVTDLSESLIGAWQNEIAQLFDSHPNAIRDIQAIHLYYETLKIPSEILFLAAWAAEVLEWHDENITLQGTHPVLRFANGKSITFHRGQKATEDSLIEFVIKAQDDDITLRCPEPNSDNQIIELIKSQLRIWSPDRRRARTFERLRSWLKEMLFA